MLKYVSSQCLRELGCVTNDSSDYERTESRTSTCPAHITIAIVDDVEALVNVNQLLSTLISFQKISYTVLSLLLTKYLSYNTRRNQRVGIYWKDMHTISIQKCVCVFK